MVTDKKIMNYLSSESERKAAAESKLSEDNLSEQERMSLMKQRDDAKKGMMSMDARGV